MENFKSRLTRVKAFILDVDGVLTDGSVTLLPDGEQVRMMNIKDGYALQLAVKKGFIVAVISGGKSEMVRKRLNGLGITDIYLGAHTKTEQYEEIIAKYNLKHEEVLYMGDDIPDYEVMRHVGVPTCPKDSAPEIKNICIYISDKNGGKGAVRDVIEQVMKVQNKWMDDDGFVW
ncbi:MAG TPA: HAD family hydrolase [Bacteroidia bacterium]|jgi:3-deoxy-D-manno-octulosonate 8-phosphate phosphatase (KDO 8-P phosphatase)|nr:HAD family hydrolase [Bacteroidia bacterium]HRG51548.1 HAD family hydrolase [Bacteroidia bacterium]